MEQDELRKKTVYVVKVLKEYSYKEIAEELLNIKYGSFINYLNNYYDLSNKKAAQLDDFLNNLIY